MKTLFIICFLGFSLHVFSQCEVHFLQNDSVQVFKKIKVKRGEIIGIPFEKSKPDERISFQKIDYININGKHLGVGHKGLVKIKDDLFNDKMTREGALDASRNYRKYKGAATGTFFTTFLTGAVLGLIPAIPTSVTTPSPKNLNIPNGPNMDDEKYLFGYKTQAKRIKSGKVWSNYGGGILCAVSATILIRTIAMAGAAK